MAIISGTIIDCASIAIACLIGILIRRKINTKSALNIIGLTALVSGLGMSLQSANILLPMTALVIGNIIGGVAQLQNRFKRFAQFGSIDNLKAKSNYTSVTIATLISLIGPLSILGSFQNGLNGNPSLLLMKTGFDFITTLILTTSLGKEVIFSIVPIFIFQAGISITASYFGNNLPKQLVVEISATGGIIMIAMALTILKIKKLDVISLLPGLIIAIALFPVFQLVGLI